MKLAVISFTQNGSKLGRQLVDLLSSHNNDCKGYSMGSRSEDYGLQPLSPPLGEWVKGQFAQVEGLIYIGAAGIAVRSIAPFIKDKKTDPAVVVIDEKGEFIIPVLSGHLGGANKLANQIADWIGGIAVITTATDINHCFAVDLFAKNQGLLIQNMTLAKEISAAVIDGQRIGLRCEYQIEGNLPVSLDTAIESALGITISVMNPQTNRQAFAKTLYLTPKIVTLGIGCKRGISSEIIQNQVIKAFTSAGISLDAIEQAATIDLKKEEQGLVEYCKLCGYPLRIYSANELEHAVGIFTASNFVQSVTGVDNVCERAAILGAMQGKLILNKYAESGVAIAAAVREWRVNFNE